VKASLKLSTGALVNLEGTPDEVRALLEHFDSRQPSGVAVPTKAAEGIREALASDGEMPDLHAIVSLVKDCEEAVAIDEYVLSVRSVRERVLLPLYIANRYVSPPVGLTSGEISGVTSELGVPVSQPNTSTALSGSAAPYVIGDRRRRKGQPVRYRLSRRGVALMESVLKGRKER